MAVQALLLVLLPAALAEVASQPSGECAMSTTSAHCMSEGHLSMMQQKLALVGQMAAGQEQVDAAVGQNSDEKEATAAEATREDHRPLAEPPVRSAMEAAPADRQQAATTAMLSESTVVRGGRLSDEEQTTPPVSTTMKCIISVTFQYFVVYTALRIARTVSLFTAMKSASVMEGILEGALNTVTFAPMVSVLFIATRMRALMLTDQQPDRYGLPQSWCKTGMVMCAIAIAALTIVNVGAGIVKEFLGFGVHAFAALRGIALVTLYVSMGIVSYGLYSMDKPKELGGSVPVSDAASCVMSLTLQYFIVQLLLQASTTYDQLKGSSNDKSLITAALEMASTTVYYAPMLSILFLAARMRSLQMGLDAPQEWARVFFYLATYCILAKILLTVAASLFAGKPPKAGNTEGEVSLPEAKDENKYFPVWAILTVVNWLITVALYVSMTAVLVSVFTIEAPGSKPTPPISTTVRIVLGLTLQFFAVYILLWCFLTAKEYGMSGVDSVLKVLIAAKDTCTFCPMLAILFVGTRMRALQLTNNQGAPQGWVQDCMQLSAWSLVIELIMVVLTELFGKNSSVMAGLTTALQYACMLMLYGGAVGVMVGVFDMTPENANGFGTLIPDVKIPSSVPPVGTVGGSN